MTDFPQDKGSPQDMSHIKGWGIDADPENDPTYPMRQRTNDNHQGYNWQRPTQQLSGEEVLHSIERPNVTAVYGTSVPPAGLSGMVRRCAFRYGEGSYAHWLLLLLADRVNSIEGIADDLWHGRLPNTCAEKGVKAQWQYDKKTVLKKAAVTTVVVTGALYWLTRRHRS